MGFSSLVESVPAIVDELVELGFGSFGRVSKRSTMNTVYKTTFDDSHYDQLALEFEAYGSCMMSADIQLSSSLYRYGQLAICRRVLGTESLGSLASGDSAGIKT